MTADTTTEAPTTEAEETPPPNPPEVPAEVKAALRKANKEAETLRLKLKELEDRDKSEQQKALERAEAAERELASERAARLRLSIAAEFGITEVADAIAGSSEEEIRANAERLAERLAPAKPEPLSTRPKPPGPRMSGDEGPVSEKEKAVAALRQLGANR